MKNTKKILSFLVILVAVFTLFGCTGGVIGDDVTKVQGVTSTEIVVGNTAATSGYFAFVGKPFNDAIKAVFKQVNDAGGIDGRTIRFVTYDDEFDASKGIALTEKLVEENKIFALVGHFGTPTVGATLDYIQEQGIPMVYAATGINALYFEQSSRNPVMAVQPIYLTDGRIMTARALNEAVYGPNGDQKLPSDAKVGVLYYNDDAGVAIKAGVEAEAKAEGKRTNFIYEVVGTGSYSTAVNKLKAAGVQTVILAMNQNPFKDTLVAMDDAGLEVPVFTSYVNADVTAVDHTKYKAGRPIFVNAWVDVFTEKGQTDVQAYIATINQADLDQATKTAYYGNSYAIAGYIAANVFIEGLKRLEANGKTMTWRNYIDAMEEKTISIPMGGTVDFTRGRRWGIDSMSLLKYSFTVQDEVVTETFVKVREIETLPTIAAKGK